MSATAFKGAFPNFFGSVSSPVFITQTDNLTVYNSVFLSKTS